MGNPPEEPLDGELESELPEELQRNENRIHLTDTDKQFLHDVGVKQRRATNPKDVGGRYRT